MHAHVKAKEYYCPYITHPLISTLDVFYHFFFLFSHLYSIMVQAFLRSFEVNLMYSSLNVISAVFESASIANILPIILEIISAALVPFYTKISDVVGRSQAMTIAAVMYLLGYTVQGTSQGFLQLSLGQIVYGVGSTGLMTLAQVLIAGKR